MLGFDCLLKRITKDARYHLRMYRAAHNLTQQEAARQFGMTPSHWSLLEAGKRRPSPEVASRLAKATGAPLALILGL